MNVENRSQSDNNLDTIKLSRGILEQNLGKSNDSNDQQQNQPDCDQSSRLKSVQEIYDKLDDIIDNSNSVKSQNESKTISSNKLVGTKRNGDKVITEDKDQLQNSDDESENEETKIKRLVQNRKSAQKCRLKKKAEFQTLKEDVKRLNLENKELKEKLNQMTTMLYTQIEENQTMHKRMESNQTQHTVFLTKLLLNQQNKSQGCQNSTQDDIQNHLQSYLGCIDGQNSAAAGLSAQTESSSFQSQLMTYLEEQMTSNPQQQFMNAVQTNISCNSTTANNASKSQSPITQNMFGPSTKNFQQGAFTMKNNMNLPNSKKMNKSPDLYNQSQSMATAYGQNQGSNTPMNVSTQHSPMLASRQPSVSGDQPGSDSNGLSWQLQNLLQNQKQSPSVSIQDLVKKIHYQKILSQKAQQGMKHAQ